MTHDLDLEIQRQTQELEKSKAKLEGLKQKSELKKDIARQEEELKAKKQKLGSIADAHTTKPSNIEQYIVAAIRSLHGKDPIDIATKIGIGAASLLAAWLIISLVFGW